jgi:anti-sigma B factor antagonist
MAGSTEAFEVELEGRGGELWVLPRGDLDLAAAPELRASLALALRSDAEAIVVDLRGLDFLDSTGLKALVEAHAGPEGHRVSFVRGTAIVDQVLQVSHLDGELRFRAP